METRTDKVVEQPTGAIMTTPNPSPTPVRRRLHPAAIRLIAVALLFAAWMSYLSYLVITMPHTGSGAPLILSRPQFLVSEVDVIAQVDGTGPEAEVTIEEVLSPKENAPFARGQKVRVVNLNLCKPLKRGDEKEEDVKLDWSGPGLYLLPLQFAGKDPKDKDVYKVTPTPPSPGYPPTGGRVGPPRIYPANDAAKAQYHTIKKP